MKDIEKLLENYSRAYKFWFICVMFVNFCFLLSNIANTFICIFNEKYLELIAETLFVVSNWGISMFVFSLTKPKMPPFPPIIHMPLPKESKNESTKN